MWRRHCCMHPWTHIMWLNKESCGVWHLLLHLRDSVCKIEVKFWLAVHSLCIRASCMFRSLSCRYVCVKISPWKERWTTLNPVLYLYLFFFHWNQARSDFYQHGTLHWCSLNIFTICNTANKNFNVFHCYCLWQTNTKVVHDYDDKRKLCQGF